MATIVTRAGKGSALTHAEVDANFTNLNNDKVETTAIANMLETSDIGTSVQAYDSNLTSFVGAFTLPTVDGTSGQTLVTNGSGTLSFSSAGSGSVTSVSVVSANGLAGTVANASTTPAITLSTTITGLLKGNGTAISAASAGTDYLEPSAIANMLETSDIGVTVQGYDADLAAFALKTAPTGDVVGTSDNQTLTTKTINLTSNTLTGTKAQFDTACSDGNFLYTDSIGVSVQAYDAQLADVAGLTPTDNGVIIGNGTNFVVETGTTLRTSLGLAIGTDVQAYDADTAKLDVAQSWTAQQTFKELKDTVHTITDGAAFEIDPANGSIQTVTLGANRTPAATNFEAGQVVLLGINDGTAYTITWTTVAVTWVKAGGTASAPTLATTGFTWVLLWKVGSTIYGTTVGSP